MKSISLLLFLFVANFSFSQKTETFYDYNWKPTTPENARYYSTLENTDSGWLRHDYFINAKKLQMRGLYKDKECKIKNGDFVYFHASGHPSSVSSWVENKQEGIGLSYYFNGMLYDSAHYANDRPTGYKLRWHRNGYLSDSIAHVNDSLDIHISWFDNGAPSAGGYERNGKRHGKWTYYHNNGNKSASVTYQNGKITAAGYFSEEGKAQTEPSEPDSDATFKKGKDAWQKYLYSGLTWPRGYSIVNSDAVTIGVQFVVDENGKVQDVDVFAPFAPQFDEVAKKLIEKSPNWTPAIQHNRRVKSFFRQSVTFRQE